MQQTSWPVRQNTHMAPTARCTNEFLHSTNLPREFIYPASLHEMNVLKFPVNSEILANISTPVTSYPTFNQHQPPMSYPASSRPGTNALSMEPTVSPQALHGVRPWDFRGQSQSNSYPSPPSEDSFMSWEPVSRRPDWPQSGRR